MRDRFFRNRALEESFGIGGTARIAMRIFDDGYRNSERGVATPVLARPRNENGPHRWEPLECWW